MAEIPLPTEITLHKQSKCLALSYDDKQYRLSAEYLRVHSPSAEVRGHGPGQEVLQTHKENVGLEKIEPVGHYALKLFFDDGHDSGLFTWEYLYELAIHQDSLWQDYLNRLQKAGYQHQQ